MSKTTCKQSEPWFGTIVMIGLGSVTFGGMIFFILLTTVNLVSESEARQATRTGLFIGSVSLTLLGLLVWLKLDHDRKYWELTNTALIGGRKQTTYIPLDTVEKVIVGLPVEAGPLSKTNRVLNPALANVTSVARANALLLKLKDGSMIPFWVLNFEDGVQFQKELFNRLKHLIDGRYEFSVAEVRALRQPRWNRRMRLTSTQPGRC
jgi:hypothetical protein